jgi:hypothetical protein
MRVMIKLKYNEDIDPEDDEGRSIVEYYFPPHVLESLAIMLGADNIEMEVESE